MKASIDIQKGGFKVVGVVKSYEQLEIIRGFFQGYFKTPHRDVHYVKQNTETLRIEYPLDQLKEAKQFIEALKHEDAVLKSRSIQCH